MEKDRERMFLNSFTGSPLSNARYTKVGIAWGPKLVHCIFTILFEFMILKIVVSLNDPNHF